MIQYSKRFFFPFSLHLFLLIYMKYVCMLCLMSSTIVRCSFFAFYIGILYHSIINFYMFSFLSASAYPNFLNFSFLFSFFFFLKEPTHFQFDPFSLGFFVIITRYYSQFKSKNDINSGFFIPLTKKF